MKVGLCCTDTDRYETCGRTLTMEMLEKQTPFPEQSCPSPQLSDLTTTRRRTHSVPHRADTTETQAAYEAGLSRERRRKVATEYIVQSQESLFISTKVSGLRANT
jgi:hypothetical protein